MLSLLLLAATVWSFAHMLLGLSDCNKMVLWPWCVSRARSNLQKKNVRSVRFAVKRRGCCCNLSIGVALNVWFTTNSAQRTCHLGFPIATKWCCDQDVKVVTLLLQWMLHWWKFNDSILLEHSHNMSYIIWQPIFI